MAGFTLDNQDNPDFLHVLHAWEAGFDEAMRAAGKTPSGSNLIPSGYMMTEGNLAILLDGLTSITQMMAIAACNGLIDMNHVADAAFLISDLTGTARDFVRGGAQ